MNEQDLVLVVDHRETTLTLEGKALRIQHPRHGFQRAPIGALGQVIVYGSPLVSCDVWRALNDHQVPVTLLPGRGRGAPAWVGAGLGPGLDLRRIQHQMNDAQRLRIAGEWVSGKIQGYRALLHGFIGEQAASRPRVLSAGPLSVEKLDGQLQQALDHVEQAADTAALMGIEGGAAAAWYAWLAENLPARWKFAGRNRRPPLDPFNSLLSLSYTLVGGEIQKAVETAGFDPALGFLHQPYPARAALALDILEPFRAGADHFALRLLESAMEPEHFRYSETEGWRLTKTGRGIYYRLWAAHRADWAGPVEAPGAEPPPAAEADADAAEDYTVSLPALAGRVVRAFAARLRKHPAEES